MMHKKVVVSRGKDLKEAQKALIMLHGRGATAEDILSLGSYLKVPDFALLAPQASANTWYPYSFLANPQANEPWLSSAIEVVGQLLEDVSKAGIPDGNIYFAGFSQGACLTLEFAARNARHYGGIIAFTGGLIGDSIRNENYRGDFGGANIFIGTSDPDPHVPVERVRESATVLERLNANVHVEIYNGMGHTISEAEIKLANTIIFGNDVQ